MIPSLQGAGTCCVRCGLATGGLVNLLALQVAALPRLGDTSNGPDKLE